MGSAPPRPGTPDTSESPPLPPGRLIRDIIFASTVASPQLREPISREEKSLFSRLIGYLGDIKRGRRITEPQLQGVISCLEPTLPVLELPGWERRIFGQDDMALFIDKFVEYPIPAQLVKWRAEVKDIIRAAAKIRKPSGARVSELPLVEEQEHEEEQYEQGHDLDHASRREHENDEKPGKQPGQVPQNTTPRASALGTGRVVSVTPCSASCIPPPSSHTGKRPSSASSTSSPKKARSDASSQVGVRCPDVLFILERVNRPDLILLTAEIKVYRTDVPDWEADRRTQWCKGIGQLVLYLFQCHEYCGTRLGLFVLRTSYSRLYVSNDKTINLECPLDAVNVVAAKLNVGANQPVASVAITAQELFDCADSLVTSMPHDWLDHDGVYDGASMSAFCNYLGLSLHQLDTTPIAALGDNLPPTAPLCLPAHLASPLPLPLTAVLELAHQAHPKSYPRWWTDAKAKLITAGSPNALVPVSAKPRSESGDKSSRGSDNGSRARSAPERESTTSGGTGTAAGAGADGDAGAGAGAGGDGGAGMGPGAGRDDVAPADAGRGPRDQGKGRLAAASPAFLDDDGDRAEHTARWLAHQHGMHLPAPVHDAPPTPDATPESSPEKLRQRQTWCETHGRLYSPTEIGRSSSVTLSEDSTRGSDGESLSSSAAEAKRQRLFERDLARFTLAGWRVRLVTPEIMTALVGQQRAK